MIAQNHATASSPFSRFLFATALAAGLAASANATTILIDFGAEATTTPTTGGQFWNNVTPTIGTTDNGSIPELVSTTGVGSGISLTMESRFGGPNSNGPGSGTTGYPGTATGDSLYGNTEDFSTVGSDNLPAFRLRGLVVGQTYDFTFFASRTGVSDNRGTLYTITGSTEGSVSLNASANTSNKVTYSGTPNASGEILINISPTAGNNNSNHFTYLNVLEINTIPEPGSLALAGLGGLLLLRRRR